MRIAVAGGRMPIATRLNRRIRARVRVGEGVARDLRPHPRAKHVPRHAERVHQRVAEESIEEHAGLAVTRDLQVTARPGAGSSPHAGMGDNRIFDVREVRLEGVPAKALEPHPPRDRVHGGTVVARHSERRGRRHHERRPVRFFSIDLVGDRNDGAGIEAAARVGDDRMIRFEPIANRLPQQRSNLGVVVGRDPALLLERRNPVPAETRAAGREREPASSRQRGDVAKVGEPVRPPPGGESLQDRLRVEVGERSWRHREQLADVARDVGAFAVDALVERADAEVVPCCEQRALARVPDREGEIADEVARTILSPPEVCGPGDVCIGHVPGGRGDVELAAELRAVIEPDVTDEEELTLGVPPRRDLSIAVDHRPAQNARRGIGSRSDGPSVRRGRGPDRE